MPIYSSIDQALAAMMHKTSELQPIQKSLYSAFESVVAEYGQFDKGIGAYGAHYAEQNPFNSEGINCANCVYYGNNACEIVAGNIAPTAVCKFWIIPESKLQGA